MTTISNAVDAVARQTAGNAPAVMVDLLHLGMLVQRAHWNATDSVRPSLPASTRTSSHRTSQLCRVTNRAAALDSRPGDNPQPRAARRRQVRLDASNLSGCSPSLASLTTPRITHPGGIP